MITPHLMQESYLQYLLSLVPFERVLRESFLTSSLNETLNFPGAFDYMTKHIGHIAPHLVEMAKNFGSIDWR